MGSHHEFKNNSFAFHESRNKIIVTFSRFSKIEVVQHVKNITLVPFCNTECFDYISRVLRTNKFPREASCM